MKYSTPKESFQTDKLFFPSTFNPLNHYIDPTKELDLIQELVDLAKEDRVYSTIYFKGRKKMMGFVVTDTPKNKEEAQWICDQRLLKEKIDSLVTISIKTFS